MNGSSPCGQINTESNKRVAALAGLSIPSLFRVSYSGLWFSPRVDFGWFCRSLGLRLRLCDSVSLLFFFFQSAARETELKDAASPQKSLHPTETPGGPAAR